MWCYKRKPVLEEKEKSQLVLIKYEECLTKTSEIYTKLKNRLNVSIGSEDVIRYRSRIKQVNVWWKMRNIIELMSYLLA